MIEWTLLTVLSLAGPPTVANDVERPEKYQSARPLADAERRRVEAQKLFAVGIAKLRREELTLALQQFRAAIERDPSHLGALRQAAPLAAQLDRRDEAVKYCKAGLALAPNDADFLYLSALLSVSVGDVDAAIAALDRLLAGLALTERTAHRFIEACQMLTQLYERKANPAGKAKTLAKLVEIFQHPTRFELDERIRRELERKKSALYQALVDALRETKDFSAAAGVIERLSSRDPSLGRQLALSLADIRFETGQYAGALASLEQYLQQVDSQNPRTFELLEKTLGKLHRHGELLDRLRSLAERHPNNPALKRFYGQKLLENNQFELAEAQLREVANDRDSLQILVRLYQKLNQPRRVLETLARFLQNARENDELTPLLEEVAGNRELVKSVAAVARQIPADDANKLREFFLVADLSQEAKETDLASEFFQRCANLAPQTKMFRTRHARALLAGEQFANALKVCDAALGRFADDVDLTQLKGMALVNLNRTDEAVALLERVRQRAAGDEHVIDASLALAMVYRQARQWDKAGATYRKLIEEFPNSREVLVCRYYLSNVYNSLGDIKKSEGELLKILEANPPPSPQLLASANNDLGYLWADEGKNLERAETMIRHAVRFEPNNAAYLDSLGWVLFKRGRFAEARDNLKKATAGRGGEDAVIWDHLGDAYLQLGDASLARESWKRAIVLFAKEPRDLLRDKGEMVRKKLELLGTAGPLKQAAVPGP